MMESTATCGVITFCIPGYCSYTIWAAHQLFMDQRVGSLEPGKRADIAVWDTDFYTAAPAAIKDARCEMTIFDGKVVWRRDP